MLDLPFNVNVCGADLYGTVVAVGVKGDKFTSIKASFVPYVMNMLRGENKNG